MKSCNIIRDDKGNVEYTEAPNGSRSQLYDTLVEKIGDQTEALKLWLTTKTKWFEKAVINPIINKHKADTMVKINNAGLDTHLNPILVRTKNRLTIFINRKISDEVFPIVTFKGDVPSKEIKDAISEYSLGRKIKTQNQILNEVKHDIALIKARREADRKLEDFERLISDVVPKARNNDFNRLEELVFLDIDPNTGAFMESSTEQFQQNMLLASKGLDPNGEPSDLVNQPSKMDWSKDINEGNFQELVNNNPELQGVFNDWKTLFDKSIELSLRELKGFRNYGLETLSKLEEYLESGDRIKVIDAITDPIASVGRIRFKQKDVNTFTVDSSLVKQGLERNGFGTQLYLRLIEFAAQRGMDVESSNKLTEGSKGVWESLVKKGVARKEGDIYAFRFNPPGIDSNKEVRIGTILNFVYRASRGEFVPSGMSAEEAFMEFDSLGVRLKNQTNERELTQLKSDGNEIIEEIKNVDSEFREVYSAYANGHDMIPISSSREGSGVELNVEFKSFPKKSPGVDYTPIIRFPRDGSLGFTEMIAYDYTIVDKNLKIIDERYEIIDDFEMFNDDKIDPNYVYRGISEAELKFIKDNGYIKSNASMNIGPNQSNTTSFAQQPSQAFNYASWFSAWYDEPSFATRKYVIKVNRKGIKLADTAGNKDSKGEIDVVNKVSSDFIEEIFEVRLVRTRGQSITFIKTPEGNLRVGSRFPGGKRYAVRSLNKPNIKNFEKELISELKGTMLGLPVDSTDDLHAKLKQGFYPNGYFNPTRESLESTGIYSSEEITELLSDENLLNIVNDFIYDLEKLNINILNDIYLNNNYIVVKDGSKNRIGKFKIDNPYIVEKKAIDLLGGINSRQEFEEILESESSLTPLLFNYISKRDTLQDLIYDFVDFKKIGVISFEEGQLVSKTDNTRDYMLQVLTVPTSTSLEKNLDFIINLDNQVFESNPEAILKLTEEVTKELVEIGMDVTNLPEIMQGKTTEEFKSFLSSIFDFITLEDNQSFENMVNEYNSFFNVNTDFKFKKVPIGEGVSEDNSFYLETSTNDLELFDKAGLIPIGKNIYKRTSLETPIEELYEEVYKRTVSNGYTNILPDEAVRPTGFDGEGTLNLSNILNPENKENILRDMKAYVQDRVSDIVNENNQISQESLEKYILLFNFYNKTSDINKYKQIPNEKSEYSIFSEDINNQDYLKSDFISDFNKKALKEKLKKSKEYQEFYSNFEINNNGINLINNDPVTFSVIEKYLDTNKDLVNYLRLNKKGIDLLPKTIEQIPTDEVFTRNFYSNYPEKVPLFKGSFNQLTENTIIAETKEPFIRVKDGIYELVVGFGNKGAYGKLKINNDLFKIYNKKLTPPTLDIDISELTAIEANLKPEVKFNNLYSSEEEKRIDEEHDNC